MGRRQQLYRAAGGSGHLEELLCPIGTSSRCSGRSTSPSVNMSGPPIRRRHGSAAATIPSCWRIRTSGRTSMSDRNIFPLFWSLYLSFCKYVGTSNKAAAWVGGSNYTELLADPDIWKNFYVRSEHLPAVLVALPLLL